jgi:hypothetical protein
MTTQQPAAMSTAQSTIPTGPSTWPRDRRDGQSQGWPVPAALVALVALSSIPLAAGVAEWAIRRPTSARRRRAAHRPASTAAAGAPS